EKQEAAVTALRQVSADIAHDLRTPLQRIAVLLSDLSGQLEDGTEQAKIADRATDEANRAVSVFQSLLQIAQIEGGAPTADFQNIDLVTIAREMIDLYEPSADDAGIALGHALPDGPVFVHGDRTMVSQALANILENALRHGKSGKVIHVSVDESEAGARLVVSDNGPGIPAEERDKVLQRLYRLEQSRTTPGNGLGLSLVAAIAQLHDADLTLADNNPGLRVSLTFPKVA
ncbi:MAG: HAMP domain-containing sensor histidine kinase, partial [Pseudomonadota bacterium]|nr:HAMP domain-containing sensor histidine kinase [Pseudomonadota bacterium]